MKKIIILIPFVLFLLAGISLYSQEPFPGGAVSKYNENHFGQNETQKKHDTAQKIVAVKQSVNANTNANKNQNQNDERPENICPSNLAWWIDSPQSIFSGLLILIVAIQAWLLLRQVIYFGRIERAYIFIKEIVLFKLVTSENGTEQSTITILFWNPGKTPAIFTHLYAVVDIRNTVPQKEDIGRVCNHEIPSGGLVIGEKESKSIPLNFRISKKEWEEIQRLTGLKLYCYGRMEYKDIFKRNQKTGFCWEWSPIHGTMYLFSDYKMNYHT